MKPHILCLLLFSMTICLHANDPLEDLDAAQQALEACVSALEASSDETQDVLKELTQASRKLVDIFLTAPETSSGLEFYNSFFSELKVLTTHLEHYHRLTDGETIASNIAYIRDLLRPDFPPFSREALAAILSPLIQSLADSVSTRSTHLLRGGATKHILVHPADCLY